VFDQIYYGDNESFSRSILQGGISNWEEISDEDFEFIKNNISRLSFKNGDQLVVVEKIDNGVPKTIAEIKDSINEEIAKNIAREAELKHKREEAAARRAMKKLEKDRNALERLIKENPDLVRDLT